MSHLKHLGLDPCAEVAHTETTENALQPLRVAETLHCQPDAIQHLQSVTPKPHLIHAKRLFPILLNDGREILPELFLHGQETGTVIYNEYVRLVKGEGWLVSNGLYFLN